MSIDYETMAATNATGGIKNIVTSEITTALSKTDKVFVNVADALRQVEVSKLGETIGSSGGSVDLTGYYTKTESDANYQPKGEYLTSVPSEYVTETELDSKIPTTLPNPQKLTFTFTDGVDVEYDGSGAVTVTIPDGSSGSATERIEKLVTDTTVELQPNKLYVFPEMTSLTYTLAAGDERAVNEYHFLFQSGAIATELVHPSGVNVGSLTIETNKIYEISVLENCLTSQSWAVTA